MTDNSATAGGWPTRASIHIDAAPLVAVFRRVGTTSLSSSGISPQPDSVTSNLAINKKKADHGQGVSGRNITREKATKFFVIKILTSKALWLKILQSIFARASQGFQRGWGRGVPPQSEIFPERNSLKTQSARPTGKVFSREISTEHLEIRLTVPSWRQSAVALRLFPGDGSRLRRLPAWRTRCLVRSSGRQRRHRGMIFRLRATR